MSKMSKEGGSKLAKNEKKQECLRMMADDIPQRDIAKKLGISESTISRWKRTPEFKKETEVGDVGLWEKLRSAAPKSVDAIIDLSINAKNESVRFAAAKDILDRLGFKPDESIKVNMEPVVIVNDLKE